MTDSQFHNEHSYLIALEMLNALQKKQLLTTEEYTNALEILKTKFTPIIDATLIVSRK